MLFNEPKLLKLERARRRPRDSVRFSALQRAEIAEIWHEHPYADDVLGFSALQRAEIAEIVVQRVVDARRRIGFSALQRAEIAEIARNGTQNRSCPSFSALQRAEIAEIRGARWSYNGSQLFQCSSTSRNC